MLPAERCPGNIINNPNSAAERNYVRTISNDLKRRRPVNFVSKHGKGAIRVNPQE